MGTAGEVGTPPGTSCRSPAFCCGACTLCPQDLVPAEGGKRQAWLGCCWQPWGLGCERAACPGAQLAGVGHADLLWRRLLAESSKDLKLLIKSLLELLTQEEASSHGRDNALNLLIRAVPRKSPREPNNSLTLWVIDQGKGSRPRRPEPSLAPSALSSPGQALGPSPQVPPLRSGL